MRWRCDTASHHDRVIGNRRQYRAIAGWRRGVRSGYLFRFANLVKDIITGVFIQFENGMNTGDLVYMEALTGTVEECRFVPSACGRIPGIPYYPVVLDHHFRQLLCAGIGSVVANYDVDRHEDADKNQALKRRGNGADGDGEDIRGLIIGEPTFAVSGLTNTAFTCAYRSPPYRSSSGRCVCP